MTKVKTLKLVEKKPRGRPPKNIRFVYIHKKMEFVKKVDELKMDGNLAENWRVFWQNFEIFSTAVELKKKDESVRIAIFLNAVGPEAIEVYNSFNLDETDKTKYDKVVDAFKNFCKPKKNEVYESFIFYTRNQGQGEPFDNFLMSIKKSVKNCNFTDESRMLRDRIVLGVHDKTLQKKMLETENLSLEKAIDLARASEATSHQLSALQRPGTSIDFINRNKQVRNIQYNKPNKNFVYNSKFTNQNNRKTVEHSTKKSDQQNRNVKNLIHAKPVNISCKFCAKRHDKGNCPAFGKKCSNCNRFNHFAIACNKMSMNEMKKNNGDNSKSDSSFYLDSVESSGDKNIQSWFELIKIENTMINFKLDTGAQVNVLPLSYIHDMKNVPVINNQIKLEAYNGSRIETIGSTKLKCIARNTILVQEFYVVKGNTSPILGLQSCINLGLIKRVNEVKLGSGEEIIAKYPEIFEGLGCFKDNFRIELKNNALPVAKPPHRVPLSVREPLHNELKRLVKKDIIEPISEPSEWVSNIVIVEKPNNEIRICLDPKHLNNSIKESFFEIPTFEEIKSKFANKKVFTVLDLKDGYWQIKLHSDSKNLCTFSTPFGCFRFKRLPFGLKIAPEVFQKLNSENFSDIPNVTIYIDDLIIAAENEKEHDRSLEMVMKRAAERNVKFNPKKIQYKVHEVQFLGHRISGEGIFISEDRIKAINDLAPPKNKNELQKLLGFINYVREFVPNLSNISAPIRELLKKNISYTWLESHNRCLKKVKEMITSAPVLKAFDETQSITLQTDASQKGLGACLMQQGRPVSFASRSLTATEENYSQIEKEFLAVVFACTKWHSLIYGKNVNIETDHKPLLGIMMKEYNKIQSPRLQRIKLKLEKYKLNFQYVPGKHLYIADLLSRNCNNSSEVESEIPGLSELVHSINISSERKKIFQEESKKDKIINELVNVVKMGWPKDKKKLYEDLKYFWKYQNELNIDDNILFFNNRIVVPVTLRQDVLKNLHKSHLGIEKTKQRARNLVYWPGMNEEIENMIAKCTICQKHRGMNIKEPLINHPLPEIPFDRICMDLMEVSGKIYLVVGDYFSKYIEIIPVRNKTARTIIGKLENIFAVYGIPRTIIADNMPFNSFEFKTFAKRMDITVITSSPLYPQSNGFSERCVQIAKGLVKKSDEEKSSLWLALLEYRNTPIKNSRLSPVEILMGRQTRSLVPGKLQFYKNNSCTKIMPTLKYNNEANKKYYDLRTKKKNDFEEGERIWLRDVAKKHWVPAKIKGKETAPRSYLVEMENGQILRRNSYLLRYRK